MNDYYSKHLSAERLRQCYDLAPPSVRRYLESEIDFVRETTGSGSVLELGCGYGRILARLLPRRGTVVGIDTSLESLRLGIEMLGRSPSCYLLGMDATRLAFRGCSFDWVVCVQNGISAFGVDPNTLLREAMRVARPGGGALFSSYSRRFWDDRLEWFRIQARHGLVGEIDEAATGEGVIVCKDGFRATTYDPADFRRLTADLGFPSKLTETDSTVFCEILRKESEREAVFPR